MSIAGLIVLASWIQVSSDHFVVISDGNQVEAQSVIEQLEAFHTIPSLLLFGRVEPEHPAVRVLLLGGKYFEQVVPYRRRDVTGFLQPAQDRDILVLSGSEAARIWSHTAYHELTHHFVERNLKQPPLWLSEGLAEYFEETDMRVNRVILRSSIIGARLSQIALPFSDLFKITKDSAEYQDARSAEGFYMRAHALVHFLLHSPYKEGFKRYLDALTTRQADLKDFLGASLAKLESDYLKHFRWCRGITESHVLDESKLDAARTKPISQADAEVEIAQVFLWRGDPDGARRLIEMVRSAEPESPALSSFLKLLERVEVQRKVANPTAETVP